MTSPEHHRQIPLGIDASTLAPETLCDSVRQTVERSPFDSLSVSGKSLDLQALLALSQSRNCMDALHLIKSYRDLLQATHETCNIPFGRKGGAHQRIDVARATQFGDLVYIPRTPGYAYVVSDVEGDMTLIREIFKKERILERLERNAPNDQVYFICLGDVVDRDGYQASQIVEFLLDLKFNRGFLPNIHLLAGNHELSPLIQIDDNQGGFFKEVVQYRSSYAMPGRRDRELEHEVKEWFYETFSCELPEDIAPGRVALWREFNELFRVCPKTIITENGLVLCHGGLTDTGPFEFLRDPEKWNKPSFEHGIQWLSNTGFAPGSLSEEESTAFSLLRGILVEDITWSDWRPDVTTTQPNLSRQIDEAGNPVPLGCYFGPEALSHYLETFGAKVMIRGHQKGAPDGARKPRDGVWHSHDMIVTINSSAPSSSWQEEGKGNFREVIQPAHSYLEIDLTRAVRGVTDVEIHSL